MFLITCSYKSFNIYDNYVVNGCYFHYIIIR